MGLIVVAAIARDLCPGNWLQLFEPVNDLLKLSNAKELFGIKANVFLEKRQKMLVRVSCFLHNILNRSGRRMGNNLL